MANAARWAANTSFDRTVEQDGKKVNQIGKIMVPFRLCRRIDGKTMHASSGQANKGECGVRTA